MPQLEEELLGQVDQTEREFKAHLRQNIRNEGSRARDAREDYFLIEHLETIKELRYTQQELTQYFADLRDGLASDEERNIVLFDARQRVKAFQAHLNGDNSVDGGGTDHHATQFAALFDSTPNRRSPIGLFTAFPIGRLIQDFGSRPISDVASALNQYKQTPGVQINQEDDGSIHLSVGISNRTDTGSTPTRMSFGITFRAGQLFAPHSIQQISLNISSRT